MITKEIQEYISQKGVFTGSRKFNCYTDDSDYDYLIYDGTKNFNYLIRNGFTYDLGDYVGDTFLSCKGITEFNSVINVLFFHCEHEYNCYRYATYGLLRLIKEDRNLRKRITDKKTRIEVFEKLKDIARITL